jgi:hypothetical protein
MTYDVSGFDSSEPPWSARVFQHLPLTPSPEESVRVVHHGETEDRLARMHSLRGLGKDAVVIFSPGAGARAQRFPR